MFSSVKTGEGNDGRAYSFSQVT